MFSDELKNLLIRVITSWQVIIVTLVILLYVAIVNHASRSHYKRKTPPLPKPAKVKHEETEPEEQADDSSLGLED